MAGIYIHQSDSVEKFTHWLQDSTGQHALCPEGLEIMKCQLLMSDQNNQLQTPLTFLAKKYQKNYVDFQMYINIFAQIRSFL